MALHLPRSERGEGSREKGKDEMILSIVLIAVIDQLVLTGRKTEINHLLSDERRFLCLPDGKGKKG
jgi:hypothetical protein